MKRTIKEQDKHLEDIPFKLDKQLKTIIAISAGLGMWLGIYLSIIIETLIK
jgi:hypothetical protein